MSMNSFQVMSEPIRRRIVEVLASGSHTSGELAAVIVAEFSVTRRAVSWHLAILLENGWLDVRDDSLVRHYILEARALERIRDDVHRLEELWRRRIGWLTDNDTNPSLANANPTAIGIVERLEPLDPREPLDRLLPGAAKGTRGRGVRRDRWRRTLGRRGFGS